MTSPSARRSSVELYESESAATIAAQERIVRDGGGAITFEITGRLSDGTDRDSLVTKYPVADADGRVIGRGLVYRAEAGVESALN